MDDNRKKTEKSDTSDKPKNQKDAKSEISDLSIRSEEPESQGVSDSEKSADLNVSKEKIPENPKSDKTEDQTPATTKSKNAKTDDKLPDKSSKSSDSATSSESSVAPSAHSSDTSGPRWYVVHTYSGHEAKVSQTLKQRIDSQKLQNKVLDILVPTQNKIEIKEGKKTAIKEKIFPGYLLVNMILDDATWLAVRTTPGITGFVGTSTKPTPLPDNEVATIKRFMQLEAPKFKTAFSAGEAVKITDGPFTEFLGTVSEIDEERGKLKVLVSIFGRETPVELDFLQVAKL